MLAALYHREATPVEAFASIICGVGAYLLTRYGLEGSSFGVVTPNAAGLLAAALGYAIFVVRRRIRVPIGSGPG